MYTNAIRRSGEFITSTSNAQSEAATWRFSPRGVAFRLFITCWLIYGLHFATNTVREIYPALSLGDHLSFDVSEYLGLHPDIFEMPGRGAFINNNPGASILGAIPYALSRPVLDRIVERVNEKRASSNQIEPPAYDTPWPLVQAFYKEAWHRGLDIKFGVAAGVMQTLLMAPLSALSVVVMFVILFSLTSSIRASTFLALLYAFATPIFYRTAQLNQNLLVSHFALFAFAMLWRPWDDPLHPKRPRYLLAGLLTGWTVVLDYSGVIVVLVLGLYGLARWLSLPASEKSPLDLLQFWLGVMLSITMLIGYQWMSFGNPLYPAQHYMPEAQFTHLGYRGLDWPHLDLLWQTAFGIRFGLFTSAPLLLLALYPSGWIRGYRIVGDRETWCIALFTLLVFIFCTANQYGRMQFNTGVRHVVPVTPFLFLIAAGVWLRMPKVLAAFVGIAGTYWSWCLAMYRDVEHGLGVLEPIRHITLEGFQLPWLTTLERMGYVPGGVFTTPLLVLCGVFLWTLWFVGTPAVTDARKSWKAVEDYKQAVSDSFQ